MLSIADVEKQLEKESAEKRKTAKAKVAAANGDKTQAATQTDAQTELEKKTAAANAKLQESRNNLVNIISDIKVLDNRIEKLNKTSNLSDEAKKELKKLQEQRCADFDKWINENRTLKGIEETLSSTAKGDLSDTIHALSQKLLSMRLEQDMQEELDKLKTAGRITEEKYLQMRAVIRGHKTVEITQAELIVNAVSEIDRSLKSYINNQAKDIMAKINIDGTAKKASSSFDALLSKEKNAYNKLKTLSGKLKSFEGMTQEKAALAVTNSISKNLNKYTNLNSFFKNLDSSIKDKTGVAISTQKLFAPVLNRINTNIGEKVSSTLQPIIKKHVKVIEQITTKIATIQARIAAAEKAFKAAVQKYQDLAKNFIQEQTKQLASKVSKELGINLGSALGGVKLGF